MHRLFPTLLVLVVAFTACSTHRSPEPTVRAPAPQGVKGGLLPLQTAHAGHQHQQPEGIPPIKPDKHAPLPPKPSGPVLLQTATTNHRPAVFEPQSFVLHCTSGSLVPQTEDHNSLDAIATLLRNQPQAAALIAGHTDSMGAANANLRLSLRRAENLRFLLVREYGVFLEQLQTRGFGESKPIADNATPKGRAANRRIEVTVSLPSAGKTQLTQRPHAPWHKTQSANQPPQLLQKTGVLPVPTTASSPGSIQIDNTPEVPPLPALAHVNYTPLDQRSETAPQTRPEMESRISGRYNAQSPEPSLSAKQGRSLLPRRGLEIVAVGDIMMGSTWQRTVLPPNDGEQLFSHALPLFQGADLVFGNLEGPLMDTGRGRKCRSGSRNCHEFRMPTRYVRHLQRAGFTALSIANNHARDFGAEGQKSTMQTLRNAGIHPVGGEAVAYLQVKGKRIAVVGFSHRGGAYSYPIQDIASAKEIVSTLSRDNDLVIVSFHGGAEGSGAARVPNRVEYFLGENRGDVRRFAHACIDAGADMVLGHGPHVLRAMERYKGKLIAYSLGNFLTYELFSTRGLCGQTVVLRATIDPESGAFLTGSLTPMKLTTSGLPRLDPSQAAARQIMQLSSQLKGDSPLRFTAELDQIRMD